MPVHRRGLRDIKSVHRRVDAIDQQAAAVVHQEQQVGHREPQALPAARGNSAVYSGGCGGSARAGVRVTR